MITCRVCSSVDISEPITLENWPVSAQKFPMEKSVSLKLRKRLTAVECLTCSHVQLVGNPVPYYREVIRSASVSRDMENFRIHQFRDLCDSILRKAFKQQTILEVGSGKYEYARIVRRMGASVLALDDNHIKTSNESDDNLRLIHGFIEESSKVNIKQQIVETGCSPIDLVYSFNFIEHWPDPLNSLKSLIDIMPEQCIYLLEVPNAEMIIQRGLFSELIPDHLSYFSFASYSMLLNRAGFEIIKLNRVYNDYILSAVCKKANVSWQSKLNKLKENYSKGIHRFKTFVEDDEAPIIVWGASHQTLVYLSALPNSTRIACVVDNADFKQNHYMIGSSYYIYPVKYLLTVKPCRLIISCGGYSAEVLRLARAMLSIEWRIFYFDEYGNIHEYI